MSLAAVILAVSAVGKEIGEALKKAAPQVPACAHGKGANGPKLVRTWPGGWKTATHAKHIFEAVNAGLIGPLNFEPVQVGSRLIVWVMRDALAIGDSPAARIPCNQSNYQRLADKLGAQVGFKLLFPTPLIVDAVHMAAAARGQVIGDPPPSIWNNGKVPEPQPVVNIGQNLDQWLRQLDRIGPVAKSGVLLSGYGKDTTVSPELVNKVGEFDSSGEAMGPKLEIYGWLTTKKQPDLPHSAAARAARYFVIQARSTSHCDFDNGPAGHGGFWDYAQTVRFVADPCLLDGQRTSLAALYKTQPDLVYEGALKRPVPVRYPGMK